MARLGLIETLRFVHEEGDVVKREAQRLADLIDAAANQRFQDRSQLDKFVGVLKVRNFELFSEVAGIRVFLKTATIDVIKKGIMSLNKSCAMTFL